MVLATGSVPLYPIFRARVSRYSLLKLFQDGQAVDAELARAEVQTVVIGAGYIGVEIAERLNVAARGFIIHAAPTTLASYYDIWK